jgi:hypothetical protein
MLRISSLALLCLSTLPTFGQDATPASTDLIKQADAAYQAKHFREGADLYARALPLVQDNDCAGIEYNLACSQALVGDNASAVDTLDHAIEVGYTDHKNSEADKDIVSLHTDPRWQRLLERMTNFTAQQDARWGDAAFATPNATNIADADKLAGLAELWAQAKFGFANFWHIPQLNWDQTYDDYIPKVLATRSTADYYRVLQSFYAQLEDGHTNVYLPELVEGKVDRLPLRTRLIDAVFSSLALATLPQTCRVSTPETKS